MQIIPFYIISLIETDPCTIEEIKKYISDMTVSKATGPKSIPTNLLNQFTDELIEPLVIIINKSLKEGIFPDILKLASVCLIYILKMIEQNVQTIGQFRFSRTSVKSLKKQCITESNYFFQNLT